MRARPPPCLPPSTRCPMPVIAQIHGAALGGGAGLAAVADIAVAAEDATFGFTEVKLGLIPAVIAPYVLAKIGQSAARELFITGRRFDAAHAQDDRPRACCRARRRADDKVNKYLNEIATNGPEAMRAAKALLRRIANRSIDEAAPLTAEAIAERRVSAEAQKLMKAFLEAVTTGRPEVGTKSQQHCRDGTLSYCVLTSSDSASTIISPVQGIAVLDAGGQYCHLLARRVREAGVQSHVLPIDTHRRSARRHQRHHHFRRAAQRHRSGFAAHASVDSLDGRADPRHLLRPSVARRDDAGRGRQAELFAGVRVGEVAAQSRPEGRHYGRGHGRTARDRAESTVRRRARQQPGVGEPRRFGGEAARRLRGARRNRRLRRRGDGQPPRSDLRRAVPSRSHA